LRRLNIEMKKCGWVQRNIVAYLSRELSRKRQLKVEQHLAGCPECLVEYQREKRIKELLSSLVEIGAESAPQLTWDNLRPSLETEAISDGREDKRERAAEYWETFLNKSVLPKCALAFSEAIYWGKRASIPVTITLLAFIFYNAFQTPLRAPATAPATAARAPSILKINFGPDSATLPEGYHMDVGKAYSASARQRDAKKYGWRG